LLVSGALIYSWVGRDAPYFQLRAAGLAAQPAQEAAAQAGQELFPGGGLQESLLRSARVWKTWVLVVIYFTTFGGFIALTAWLPTYWKSYFGTSPVTAGLLTALFSILASLTRVAGGKVSDRLGGETTAQFALFALLAGAGLMSVSSGISLSVAAEIIMALGIGIANAAVFKLVPQEVPQAVGGASGWIGGLGAFGGFAIPPILGAIARAQGLAGYASGFWVFAGLALLSLGLVLLLKRRPAAAQHYAEAQAK